MKWLRIAVCLAITALWFNVCGTVGLAATEEWIELGQHKVTFYCNCSRCCGKWAGGKTASGTYPERYRTAAVNPKEIGLGETIFIDGFGMRVAEDTGVPVGTIDIFIPDHQLCLKYGVKYRNVWIVREVEE